MASLKDVAARAGVSISTVRCALYGLGPIRPDTRERVLQAVADLAYVPNPHARALVGGRAPLIALVVPSLVWYVANALVVTLQQRLATLGLRSVFFVGSAGTVEQNVSEIAQLAPQAVVLMQVVWHDEYRRLAASGIRLLAIDVRPQLPPDLPGDAVGLDRVGAFGDATRHLLGLGHHRVGLLDSFGATGRQEGYTRALAEAGNPFRAIAVADAAGQHAPTIRASLETLLTAHPDLTGLVCTTDLWALEAIHHLAALGRSVPGDISVTGYSNEPWTGWSQPALTTLDQGTALLCDHALEMLTQRLEGGDETGRREIIRPELVVRASTAAPRGQRREL